MSVASSVPRSQASAHQSSGSSRRSATRWAGREREPDRATAAKELFRVGEGSSWPSTPERRGGRQQCRRAEREVEGDHVPVGQAQGLLGVHSGAIQPHSRPRAVHLLGRSLQYPCSGGRETRSGGETSGREQDRDNVPPRRRQVRTARRARHAPARSNRPNGKTLSAYITERFDEFSRSQKDVARYIVDHLDEAAFQTAEELARRADTSSSTVVRFSQALGFEGYPELQQAAIEEYRQPRGRGRRRRRRSAVRLRPLRLRGLAGRRPRQRRGDRPQPHPRAGRGLRDGPRRRPPGDDRRARPARLLRVATCVTCWPCSTSAPRSSPARARTPSPASRGSTRTAS